MNCTGKKWAFSKAAVMARMKMEMVRACAMHIYERFPVFEGCRRAFIEVSEAKRGENDIKIIQDPCDLANS